MPQLRTFSKYENCVARAIRLYEQKKTAPDREAVLGDYVRRWLCWVPAGLGIRKRAFSTGTYPEMVGNSPIVDCG